MKLPKTTQEISNAIIEQFNEKYIFSIENSNYQPNLVIDAEKLIEISDFLHRDSRFYFDYLNCISCVDFREKNNCFQLTYSLTSLYHEHTLHLKCNLSIPELPEIPLINSVSNIWRAADWHEREIYDLFGVRFEQHPDLRRILLPEDWEGYPMRKDYKTAENYHDIKIDY